MLSRNKLRSFLAKLGFGERRCYCCHKPYFPDDLNSPWLCRDCQISLAPYIGPRCEACGLPGIAARAKNGRISCPDCAANTPAWSKITYHGLYEGSLKMMLLRLKFDSEPGLATPLAGMMLDATMCLPAPDVLTAIPQHPSHLAKRGFNQAHELAKSLARMSGFALSTKLLKRVKQQKKQEALTAAERRRNLADAFVASAAQGLKIWLIDDVVTTGSTCHNAAWALLAQGAARVDIVAVARTPL